MMMIEDEIHELKFDINRSIRYHEKRRNFFESLNTLASAMSLMMGSTAFFALLKSDQDLLILSTACVSALSAINLVAGSTRKAILHHDLGRKFIELEKKIVLTSEADFSQKLKQWTGERLDIEMQEPPVLRVLDGICYNDVARAMGYEKSYFLKISWFQRLFAQLFDVRDHVITA